MMHHDVFISFSSVDSSVATAVRNVLEATGRPCWHAPRDIPPGSEFGSEIVAAIEATRVVVLVYSSASLVSPYVQREVSLAVGMGKPLIPVRIADVPAQGTMRFFLQAYQFYDALGHPIECYLHTLPAAVSALLAHGATPLETGSPPWRRHLLALREDGQISPVAFDQTLRLIEDSPFILGHLERFERDWLSERDVSPGNAVIQQALTAVCFGLDVRLRLLDVDFVLVPPGRAMTSWSNHRPFYLSTTILTTNTHESLRDDVTPSEPAGSAGAGLSLAAAEDGIGRLNEQLSAQARSGTHSPAENEIIEDFTSDLFWLRLPRKRELEFAAGLNGPIAVQRCRTVAEVTDTRRHPLGIAGLIGGLWQFCSGDAAGDYWTWGGTHRMSAREFTQQVPTVRCLNEMLKSSDYGLRPLADPTDRTIS